MSLINPAILYGMGLAVIPVILHFLLRSKPKKLMFPALRLIQARRRQNVRRMRLRHIWLLLLRIAIIVCLVLAMARPSLPAADYSLSLGETLIGLAIIAFAAGVYWGMASYWRRRRLPNHVMASRRTYLRGVSGLSVLVLLLLLVAWPYQKRIAAEIAAPLPDVAADLPVAGIFLFDTSSSMEYRNENSTRLELAKKIAIEQLSNLPARSRIAAGDTSTNSPLLFQGDLAGAQARIAALEVRPVSHALNDRLRNALALQDEDHGRTLSSQESVPDADRQDRYLREIYVFTDLARSGWRTGASKILREELKRLSWVNVYIIDVGVTKPVNVGLSKLKLSKQTLPLGGKLFVELTVGATGLDEIERTVEIYVRNDSGKLVKQGKLSVDLDGENDAGVQFDLIGLTGPINQGEVRLISSDPLPDDDVRYFTVEVRPPSEILLVAPTRERADYLLAALAPRELVRLGRARYRCTYLHSSKLAAADLKKFAVVCLISVEAPSANDWDTLAAYVNSGGGLAIFLGTPSIDTNLAYNSDTAQSLLPGKLLAFLKFHPVAYFDLQNLTHPILKKFEDYGGTGELSSVDVRRYWRVEPSEDASVIATYTDARQAPALLEQVHGKGRTVLLTTGIDLKGWSDLPRAGWSFLAFTDQMMHYLSQRAQTKFNYSAGDNVLLNLDPEQPLNRYLLRKPGFQQLRGDVPAGATSLTIREADRLGHYEVVGEEADSEFTAGFSVNAVDAESDFTRLTDFDLNELLGEDRYGVARDFEGLTRRVTAGRIGREVFSIVLTLAVLVFCVEHIVANRFYQADQAQAESAPTAA